MLKYIYTIFMIVIDVIFINLFYSKINPLIKELLSEYNSVTYIIYALSLLVFGVILFKQIKFYFNYLKEYNMDQFGSSTFVKRKDLNKQYLQVPKYGKFEGKGGFVVAWTKGGQNVRSNKMLVDNSATNMAIYATTRGGKGELVILPTIDNLSRGSEKPSMIIFDKKPELYNLFGEQLNKRGYDVKVLNLKDLEMSMGYNPLSLGIEYYFSGKKSKAENEFMSVSENLIPDEGKDIWGNTARILFRAGVFALLEEVEEGNLEKEDVNLFSLYTFLSNMASMSVDEENALSIYFDKKPTDSIAKATFNAINSTDSENIWNSIKISALPKIEQFRQEDLAKATSKDTINLLDFGYGEKPVALFIAFPSMNEKLEKLASIYLDQVFTRLDEYTEKTGGKMDRDLYFILDEVASVRKIDTIGKILSTGLGKGFRSLVVLQDPAQLEKQYKKPEAEEILENCAVEMYIISKNEKFNEEFSKRVGEYTKLEINRSATFGKEKSFNKTYRSRRLIRADELIQLEIGESVVLRPNYRKDHKNKKIKSKPISNLGKDKMLQRHEYMDLEYKNISEMTYIYDESISEITFDKTFKRLDNIFDKYKEIKEDKMSIKQEKEETLDFRDIKILDLIHEIDEEYELALFFKEKEDQDMILNLIKKVMELENPKLKYDKTYLEIVKYYKQTNL